MYTKLMKRKWVWILLVVILGAAAFAGNVLATPASGQGTTILAKATFGQLDLKAKTIPADLWQAEIKTKGPSDVYVVDNKFAVGGTTGWHSHPGPSLIFVVAGTITNYMGDDPTCTGRSIPPEAASSMRVGRTNTSCGTRATFQQRRSRCSSFPRTPCGGSTNPPQATALSRTLEPTAERDGALRPPLLPLQTWAAGSSVCDFF